MARIRIKEGLVVHSETKTFDSDLHFHDLRHDGISRLFEPGWNIPNVAAVSGHRTWSSLRLYTHIRHRSDKYAAWPWLERLGIHSSTPKGKPEAS